MDIKALIKTLESSSHDEFDAILDKRDEKPFDTAWSDTNELIPQKGRIPDEESTFKHISIATNHHEITSYIIDDLNLIHNANTGNIENTFIDLLASCYQRGIVPDSWDVN